MFSPFHPDDEWVRIKVKDPPEDGKPNTAIIALLAKTLSVPKRNIKIIRGETSHIKQMSIQCSAIAPLLEQLAHTLRVKKRRIATFD